MDYDEEEFTPPTSVTEVVENDDGSAEIRIRIEPPSAEDIANAVAQRLLASYSDSKKLHEEAGARFETLIAGAVNDAAKSAIADAMGQARQPTDEFGNPTGPARTFSQMIGEQVIAWQAQTVDAYSGQPKAKSSYGGSDVITRAEYLVRQVGAAEFEKLAKAEVAKIRTDAKAKVEKTIKDTVAASLVAMAK